MTIADEKVRRDLKMFSADALKAVQLAYSKAAATAAESGALGGSRDYLARENAVLDAVKTQLQEMTKIAKPSAAEAEFQEAAEALVKNVATFLRSRREHLSSFPGAPRYESQVDGKLSETVEATVAQLSRSVRAARRDRGRTLLANIVAAIVAGVVVLLLSMWFTG